VGAVDPKGLFEFCSDKCKSGQVQATAETRTTPSNLSPEGEEYILRKLEDLSRVGDYGQLIGSLITGGAVGVAVELVSSKVDPRGDLPEWTLKGGIEAARYNNGLALYTRIRYRHCRQESCCLGLYQRLNWSPWIEQPAKGWRKCSIGLDELLGAYPDLESAMNQRSACIQEHLREVLQ
jgi:hypothetical protein